MCVSAGANFMTAAPSWLLLSAERGAQTAAAECGRTSHALCSLSRAQSNPACIINCKLREVKSLMCMCRVREREKKSRGRRAIDFVSSGRVCELVSEGIIHGAFLSTRPRASGELSKQPDGEKVVVRIRLHRQPADCYKMDLLRFRFVLRQSICIFAEIIL